MRNRMWTVDSNYNQILDYAYSFQKSKVLFTAIELDIFNTVGHSTYTSEALAAKLNTDSRATDRLLNTLCSMGLMTKDGDLFVNSSATKMHLVEDSPEYIGSLMHVNNLWDSWTDLTECIRNGNSPDFKTINEKPDDWIEDYLTSLQWKAFHEAPEILNMMDLRDCHSLLDLGCGSAYYSMEIAKIHPQIKCFALDYPKVIEQTQKFIESANLPNRVKTLPADFMNDDIGKNYDCVLISYVLNEYSIWDNIKLLRKIYDSLNKNGKVVIHQRIIDDERISPHLATMEALNMIVNTPNGDCFTETDIWVMLKESWFENIEKYDSEFGTSIIVANKATSF